MKILLINPPIRENEPPRHIPMGLGVIASVLLNEGHEVKVLDINAERLSNSQVQERIDLGSKYEIIGTGGLITTYKYLKWLIPQLKKYNPASRVVIGGGVVTENPALLLSRTPADIAVIGEGEITMVELVSALESNNSLETTKGIAYKDDKGQVRINPLRPLIKDLDSLPFPAYNLFPMDIYLHNVAHASVLGKKTEITIITGRGCPYKCEYCFHIFGRGIRSRSIDNVLEEIKFLIETYEVESLLISDETFTINKKRVNEFCERFSTENITVPWSCYARVNLVDAEMLKNMKQAGCYRVSYGIESGSQKILDNMNKQVTVEQAKKAVRLARSVGLACGTTFMFGYPGETLETIRETGDFCKDLLITPTLFFTTPYPGTRLYSQVKEKIINRYGDEEKFIEVLGDVSEFTINLTDFPDETLYKLKEQTQKLLHKIPLLKCPEYIYILHKQYGLPVLAKHFARKILNKLHLKTFL